MPRAPAVPASGSPRHHGSCLCGAVRYEIAGELGPAYYCHCSRCRKSSGTGHAANAVMARTQFLVRAGLDQLRSYVADNGVERLFCGTCGSPLAVGRGEHLRLRLGSLDSPLALGPQVRIFVGSKAAWEAIDDDLPRHAERPAVWPSAG